MALWSKTGGAGMANDTLMPDCNVPILKTATGLFMFRMLALGKLHCRSAGQAPRQYGRGGIDRRNVTAVVFTLVIRTFVGWSMISTRLVFNARFYMGRTEWISARRHELMPMLRRRQDIRGRGQNRWVLEDCYLFDQGAEVACGRRGGRHIGHTRSQCPFMLAWRSDRC